jgi:hypothetical protein
MILSKAEVPNDSPVHELWLAVDELLNDGVKDFYDTITPEQYSDFQKQWLFDSLAGRRYGQAFCDYFGIPNTTMLYHFRDIEICERWIRDNYLVDKSQ